LILIFNLSGVAGAILLVTAFGSSDRLLLAAVTAGDTLGLGASSIFALLNLLGFVLGMALLGQWLVRRIGRRYESKKTSDQFLVLDSMFLLFGLTLSIDFVFEDWRWIFAGPLAFIAYKAAVLAAFKWAVPFRSEDTVAPTLLLLRVFKLGKKSMRLFDSVIGRWRHVGGVTMIAGPDLATSTVEPHEIIQFLTGKLSKQFVRNGDDLQKRVSGLDTARDRDGRYRVSEFFCYTDTWQLTMQSLAGGAAAVLMDLRSFSARNQGCLFEIEQLLARIPLDRVVFVTDSTTDREFLSNCLKERWKAASVSSPNRLAAHPKVRIFELKRSETRSGHQLLQALLSAASGLSMNQAGPQPALR
jgi:hypothetical protein